VIDLQSLVAPTYDGLADLLASVPPEAWDAPSLCEKWQVRHVVAHMTMPARFSGEQFGAEMAAAGGDFTLFVETVAARDASLPIAEHLDALRSEKLHDWQPPDGSAAGALSHAIIHSLDITIALDRQLVAPNEAVIAVLDHLTAADGAVFGVDITGVHLKASDSGWNWGSGEPLSANGGQLVALLSGRTLPDERVLQGVVTSEEHSEIIEGDK
jgi:uncharacterized protein (TIGR03083 family)